ncbi:STE24 endopeptidase [Mucilaginibacter frigoritolerans]|uniref:STE24 endopeptidase n=1 Tax=Mucilaginibacter frigoritolerans TaxID=652788 RepID=A0A562TSX6_9SPHI|nr:M48 family metalloprotease [Mucilaginibacter frigoritolerans]TWI96719.1 STE24 endopeptidase [Mucilaginibacter frigoritolerans]
MKTPIILFFCLLSFTLACAQTNQTISNHIISHIDAEKGTTQLINTIPLSVREKANNYCEGSYWLLLWNIVCAALVAWLFLFGGLSKYILKRSNKIKAINRGNFIFIVFYFLLTFLLLLPLDIYQNFIREHQYGFSNQGFVQWFLNDLITFIVELIIAAPFFVLVYGIFRKTKENWWIWGTTVSIVFITGLIIIYPVFIAPIFNQYIPLKNGYLKNQILSMARANRVNVDNVYVYNESQQTKVFNAEVSGFAGTARISLNDNMLNHCTNNEIKAALAHEMGHYVLRHLFILTLEYGLLILIGFKLIQWSVTKLINKYSDKWQMKSIQDITSLPVLVFLFTFYFFILTPVTNSITRVIEIEADNYGLNAARQPDAFASLMLKSADNHKIDPGYWEEIIFFDHPCRKQRILSAMIWKAEN